MTHSFFVSGRLIPIDFGHAFGSATEHLAIPEVVPFRLTRQFVGVLDPLGISGILETAMVNVLQGKSRKVIRKKN